MLRRFTNILKGKINTKMSDTAFRAKVEPAKSESEVLPGGKTPNVIETIKEEVPYMDYERENNHPFTVDYFKLGDAWEDPTGGFPKEVSLIEEYVKSKIDSGETANSVEAIKDVLKGIEKTTNTTKEGRNIVKMETIAAYVKFLMKSDNIKFNVSRYGRSNN